MEPVPSGHEFLFHKTTVREVYDNARSRFPGAPDVLLWNEVGELTETTIGNLVVRLDGRLITPPVTCGLLPGTFRAQLLADGEVVEQVIPRSDLDRADGVWMVNSVPFCDFISLFQPEIGADFHNLYSLLQYRYAGFCAGFMRESREHHIQAAA